MNRISYSQLSMFSECPLRWKLNYVDDLRISESNIYLIFGTAMHEVLQTYLEILYNDSAKNADLLDLNEMLRDKLIEQFKIAKENDDKEPSIGAFIGNSIWQSVLIVIYFVCLACILLTAPTCGCHRYPLSTGGRNYVDIMLFQRQRR